MQASKQYFLIDHHVCGWRTHEEIQVRGFFFWPPPPSLVPSYVARGSPWPFQEPPPPPQYQGWKDWFLEWKIIHSSRIGILGGKNLSIMHCHQVVEERRHLLQVPGACG